MPGDNTYTVHLEDGTDWDVHSNIPLSQYDTYMAAKALQHQFHTEALNKASKAMPLAPVTVPKDAIPITPKATGPLSKGSVVAQPEFDQGISPRQQKIEANEPMGGTITAEEARQAAGAIDRPSQLEKLGGELSQGAQYIGQGIENLVRPHVIHHPGEPPDFISPDVQDVIWKNITQANPLSIALGLPSMGISAATHPTETAISFADPIYKLMGQEPGTAAEKVQGGANLLGAALGVEGLKSGVESGIAKFKGNPLDIAAGTTKENLNAIQEQSPAGIPRSEQPSGSEGIRQPNPEVGLQEPTAARPQETNQTPQVQESLGGGNERNPPSAEPIQAKEVNKEPDFVGIRHQSTDEIMRSLGVPEHTHTGQPTSEWLDAGKPLVNDALGIAADALKTGKRLEQPQEAAVAIKQAEQQGIVDRQRSELYGLKEDDPSYAAKEEILSQSERDLQTLAQANAEHGTSLGQSLAYRKTEIATDFSDSGLYRQMYQARRGEGKPVSAEDQAAVSAQAAEEAKNNAAELDALTKQAEVTTQTLGRSTYKKEVILAEREQILTDLKNHLKTALGSANSPGQAIYESAKFGQAAGKLAINYMKEGVVNLEDVVGRVIGTLGQHGIVATREDVLKDIDTITTRKPINPSEIAKNKAKLVKQAKMYSRAIEANTSKPTKESVAIEATNKRIAELENQIKTGNFEEKGQKAVSDELKDLRKKQAELSVKAKYIQDRAARLTKDQQALKKAQEGIAKYDQMLADKTPNVPRPPKPISDAVAAARGARDASRLRWLRSIAPKASPVEIALMARKWGMLSSPRTLFKITGSLTASQIADTMARIPASLTDYLISKGTGNRTIALGDIGSMKEAAQSAATQGVANAKSIMQHGATADQLLSMQFPKEMQTHSPALNTAFNSVFRSHGAVYSIFEEYAMKQQLLESAKLLSKKSGRRVEDILANPPKDIVDLAKQAGKESVFLNKNAASTAIGVAKKVPVLGKVLDFAVPFDKVPTNIAGRTAEFGGAGIPYEIGKAASRAGGVKGILKGGDLIKRAFPDQISQRNFSMAIGRGAVGIPLIYLGVKLAQKGLATASETLTGGTKGREQAAGRPRGAIKIGNRWYALGDSAAGATILMGAKIVEDKDQSTLAEIESAGKSLLETGSKLPMVEGVSELGQAMANPQKELPHYAQTEASTLVPNILGDVAGFTNPGTKAVGSIKDALKNKIPGLRGELPASHDALGNEIPAPNPLDPFKSVPDRSNDPVIQAFLKSEGSLTMPAKKQGESTADYQKRVQVAGQQLKATLSTVVSNDEFKHATPQIQKELLKIVVRDDRVSKMPAEYRSAYVNAIVGPLAGMMASKDYQSADKATQGKERAAITKYVSETMKP